MQDKPHPRRHGWRIVRRIGLGLLGLVAVLGTAGALWNALALHHYRSANPPPGKLYAVNGHTMHLYCTGSGTPTIVLESGRGEDFTVWAKVQPVLSHSTRTCSYDRAGFGWSEAQPGTRDANSIARQLHTLLLEADITAPVVLMGHSAGGVYIRAYASQFPAAVAGLIFVDASTPEQAHTMPPAVAALEQHSAFEYTMLKSMFALGIVRLSGRCTAVLPGFEAYAGWIRANTCVPSQIDAYRREVAGWPSSLAETAQDGPYGDLPVLIFSRDPAQALPHGFPLRVSAALFHRTNLLWDGLQEKLKQLSTRSRRIVAQRSGHYIQWDRPDLLNREVPAFILHIRDGITAPDNGSTRAE
jgi:pimeloyl-ACP methyl ester carboxylesterase